MSTPLASYFKAKGFQISGVFPVDKYRFPHAVEFDCILLPTETQHSIAS